MTIIKKLQIKGFKSFAKPTSLIFDNGFNCCIGPNGSGKSCSYDTIVSLNNGEETQIGSLVEEQLKKAEIIRNLDDGIYCESKKPIKILSLNPSFMKIEEKEVSKFIKRSGDPFLYEIRTRTGKKIKTTGCHPVMVFKDGEIKSSLVRNLKKDDLICSPRIISTRGKKFNSELARLMGCLIGDGYIEKKSIRFTNSDIGLLNDFQEIVLSIFKTKPDQIYKKRDGYTYDLRYTNKDFIKEINLLFDIKDKINASSKRIPNKLLKSDLNSISHLIAGLCDTDGHVSKSSVEFCSKSEMLMNQLQMLLLRFGVSSIKRRRLCCATNTKNKIKKEYYYLYVNGTENLKKFYIHIPLKCRHKKENLEKIINLKKIPNPNIDLLPKKTNLLVKKAVNLLGLKVKNLKNQYPKLAAYYKDRCNPSRRGLKEILQLFDLKLFQIYDEWRSLSYSQIGLVKVMDLLNISGAFASQSIGLTKDVIRRDWATGKFKARPENLDNFFNFIEFSLESRLKKLKRTMSTLHKLASSDIFWDEIVDIRKVEGEEYVYDLTIPDNHNFMGDGIFVHNSNICDSLCFVLGKTSAKGLRAEKSSNLIYNGGKSRDPAKEAEVSVVFDNSNKAFPIKEKELTITRIVRQSGQSVYKINNEVRTRQQMVDVLRKAKIDPDGHNVVLQGDIVRFMEMRPVERRELIEEVAGISVYEEKKQKAINEMENVQKRLDEANIILTERGTHLRELKKDRNQALRYKELEKNIKSNKATYLNMQIKAKEEKKQEIETKLGNQEKEIEKIKNRVKEIQKEIYEKRDESKKLNSEIEEKGEKEQVELHKSLEDLKTKIVRDESRLETCNNELEKIKTRTGQLRKSLQEIDEKVESLTREKENLEKKAKRLAFEEENLNKDISKFKAKHGLTMDYSTIDEIDREIEKTQEDITKLNENKQTLIIERNQTEFKIKSLKDEIKKTLGTREEDRKKLNRLKETKQSFKAVAQELNKAIDKNLQLNAQLGNARENYMKRSEELSGLKARDITKTETVRGDIAVKRILEMRSKNIYGTVADLGKVNPNYSLALEVAAGARIKSIVVEDDNTAANCIRFLKEKKLGVVTFLPLNKIRNLNIPQGIRQMKDKTGVRGLAIDLVSCDAKFKSVFSYVLGATLVVDDINTAKRIGIGNVRMVTAEGDLMETSGAMIGGYRRRGYGMFKGKDIDKEITKMEDEVTRLRDIIKKLEDQKAENEDRINGMREKKASLEIDIVRLEQSAEREDYEDVRREKEIMEKEIREVMEELKNVEGMIKKQVLEIESLKKRKNDARKDRKEMKFESLSKLEEEKQKISMQLVETKSFIKNIENQTSTIHEPEKNKIRELLRDHDKETDQFWNEAEGIKESLKKDKEDLRNKESLERKFYNNYKNLFTRRNKTNEVIQSKENLITRENEKIKVIESRINNLNIERARIVGELEGFNEEFKEFAGEKIRRNVQLEELKYEIRKFENLMRNMGNVNLRALEVYEKINKEYEQILSKAETLKKEKEDILGLMAEIDGKKQSIFMKTFKILDKNFREIFMQLNTKGNAYLEIENRENVFEGGVSIKVKIIGKKFLDIRSLSGGEKTLTALSFIFAIQEYAPANFYLLDEVDAALDKNNSAMLSKLIQKYAKTAQYIVISHNDHVITEADQLYGISMQDGISKALSLKI